MNTKFDNMTSPGEKIDLSISSAKKSYETSMDKYAEYIGNKKKLEKSIDSSKIKIENYKKAAKAAVDDGDDEAAKQILSLKVAEENILAELQKSYDIVKKNVSDIKIALEEKRNNIHALDNKKVELDSRYTAALLAKERAGLASDGDFGAEDISSYQKEIEAAERQVVKAESYNEAFSSVSDDNNIKASGAKKYIDAQTKESSVASTEVLKQLDDLKAARK